jgi:hypothetical protein
MTGPNREPTFLIVGAAKAGTTSLAAYLGGHPHVFVAPEKEVHFFDHDRKYARGWQWYCDRFAGGADAAAVGEASPTYMWEQRAIERMAHHLPRAQLIAVLRNPVDRAYSHYWHMRGFDAESRPFEQALDDPQTELRHGYLARGRYAEQLKRLHAYFSPEQVRVVLFDDLVGDTDVAFAGICRWLGVEPIAAPGLGEIHNARFRLRSPRLVNVLAATQAWRRWPALAEALMRLNRVPVEAQPMDPATRARLVEVFAPDNAELASLLGRDLSGWNR